ncbi:MAG TPA: ABC transporter substrate-binding protein, partial [Myxococcota bacterium]|nr:ABC transporter substrate-binding protein [Myxococcota bacterium]
MSDLDRWTARRVGRRTFLREAAASVALLPLVGCGAQESESGQGAASAARAQPLLVGGLPVTCNLTLPIACVARGAAKSPGRSFEFSKYSGWPEIKESLMTGRIQAAYMLAPLVMDLASKNIPIKVVSLGHRSGAVIMVRTDSPYKKFKDLTGKRVA